MPHTNTHLCARMMIHAAGAITVTQTGWEQTVYEGTV